MQGVLIMATQTSLIAQQSGKKAANISGLPVQRIDHYLSLEELAEEFGENGWK